VKIYRHQDESYPVFTLVYYFHGERKRPTFASLDEAREEADRVLDQLNNGEPDVLTLTSTERHVGLAADRPGTVASSSLLRRSDLIDYFGQNGFPGLTNFTFLCAFFGPDKFLRHSLERVGWA